MIKDVTILGSTGSIGRQALDVCRRLGIYPRYLTAGKNYLTLLEQISEFSPEIVAVVDLATRNKLLEEAKLQNIQLPTVLVGEPGLEEIAKLKTGRSLVAISGFAGLKPVYYAIQAGQDIALANKECIVVAGDLLLSLARSKGVDIYPVDSEHSAIWQCLAAAPEKSHRKIFLTASGGPFLNTSKDDLEEVSADQALAHPLWSMGAKISIDSATMFNKALELIEAIKLFDLPEDKIEILIHPEGVLHSAVEFHDGSILGQMALADMRLPIQLALTWPERVDTGLEAFDFFSEASKRTLSFQAVDYQQFPSIKLARRVASQGGILPLVMNSANEVAVARFLSGQLKFLDIYPVVESAVEHFAQENMPEPILNHQTDLALDVMIKYDLRVREWTKNLIDESFL